MVDAWVLAGDLYSCRRAILIGRQEDTGFGGRIDLLAIAPDGARVLIEIKRDKTPRDVIAPSLDYANWVERQRTERIVAYLNERDIPINVLCFQAFANGNEQLISRTWLLDPVKTQVSAATKQDGPKEPWNSEFYHSFGTYSGERSWDDAVKYGFICGGGDIWYSRTLRFLNPGDRVWAKIPGSGFVGVGRVTGRAQRYRDFMVNSPEGEVPFSTVERKGHYHEQFADDDTKSECFVPVHWLQTVPASQAIQPASLPLSILDAACKPNESRTHRSCMSILHRPGIRVSVHLENAEELE